MPGEGWPTPQYRASWSNDLNGQPQYIHDYIPFVAVTERKKKKKTAFMSDSSSNFVTGDIQTPLTV